MTATSCPFCDEERASSAPTLPHPTTMMCMASILQVIRNLGYHDVLAPEQRPPQHSRGLGMQDPGPAPGGDEVRNDDGQDLVRPPLGFELVHVLHDLLDQRP